MTTLLQLHSNPYIYIYIYIDIYKYIYLYVCMYVLWHGVTLNPWPPQEPTPLRFPVWLGIPKPMIPYPLLWEGAVRTVGSHLGRIHNCSEVPDTPPPPPGTPGTAGTALPGTPPRTPPSKPPPPPRGLRPTVSWGGSWRPGPRGRPPPRGETLFHTHPHPTPPHFSCLATSPRGAKMSQQFVPTNNVLIILR